MVFVWSLLVDGNAAFTLIQVAVNDLLVLALYVPIVILLLGVTDIPLPYGTVAASVALFVAAPMLAAAAVRFVVLRRRGQLALDRVINAFKPVTSAGLLATLVLIFVYQGRTIGDKPVHILRIAVPLLLQTYLIFGVAYGLGYLFRIPHEFLGPASLIATSNFFELAVAVSVSVYGTDSGAALATVVGVLVEVPVMLSLVWLCHRLRPRLDARLMRHMMRPTADAVRESGKTSGGGGGGTHRAGGD